MMVTIIDPLEIDNSQKSGGGSLLKASTAKGKSLEIDPRRLQQEIENLREIVNGLDASPAESGFCLEEIELTAAITTKGKIAILGSGAEAGVSAGLKIRFKKSEK